MKKQQQNNIQQINSEIWREYYESINQSEYYQVNKEKYRVFVRQIVVKGQLSRVYKILVLQYDEIPSTMILSEKWPREYLYQDVIFCFIAKSQSAGVGQRQNKWKSPQGNLYMTILLKNSVNKIIETPIRVANSIASTIQKYIQVVKVQCKWVNDIFLNNKKTSGFLVRHSLSNNELVSQIGIGLNVKNAPEQFEYVERFIKSNYPAINLRSLADNVIEEVIKRLKLNTIKYQDELKQYENRLMYMNEQVSIIHIEKEICKGKFIGINQNGHALIQTNKGIEIISDGRMKRHQEEKVKSFTPVNLKQIMKEL